MAKKKKPDKSDPWKQFDTRLRSMEKMLRQVLATGNGTQKAQVCETAVAPWQFLVRRQHPWRKQLYIKGRNLTARQLVGSIKANQFGDEEAARNFHLPIEAIREALTYAAQNGRLLETEAEIERLMGKREGTPRVAEPVS